MERRAFPWAFSLFCVLVFFIYLGPGIRLLPAAGAGEPLDWAFVSYYVCGGHWGTWRRCGVADGAWWQTWRGWTFDPGFGGRAGAYGNVLGEVRHVAAGVGVVSPMNVAWMWCSP